MNQPAQSEQVVKPVVSQPIVVQIAPKTQPETSPAPPGDLVIEKTVDSTPVNPDDLITQDYYLTSPLFYQIANYFGIEEKDYDRSKDKLSVITDWAIKKNNSNKLEDILTTIRELEEVLAPPGFGERRYAKVYGYLRLLGQKESFEKALSAFEKKKSNNE